MEQQLSLFDIPPSYQPRHSQSLVMDGETLMAWKARIVQYQQQVQLQASPQQGILFELPQAHCQPEAIEPFALPPVALSFYRMPVVDQGQACLYFIIDRVLPLLLYVGETKASNQRWKSTHDCKDYIENYVALHRQYGLDVAVCAAFWWDAPAHRKSRQQLEQALIQRWKPPFNKEMWQLWGQPFPAYRAL